ncbi:hypothetical protein [Rubritalea tangerina]
MFTDRGLEMVSGAQPRSAVGCSVLFCKGSPSGNRHLKSNLYYRAH